MTRTQARTAIAAYFGGSVFDPGAQIYRPTPLQTHGLGGVRAYVPAQVTTEDRLIGLPPGTAMGAVMGVWLGQSVETRLTLGGTITRPYAVELYLWHLSLGPRTEDAQAQVDDLVEAVIARIRADPTLGGSVTQAGETDRGITTSPAVPYTEPGAAPRTLQDLVISFDANTYPNIQT